MNAIVAVANPLGYTSRQELALFSGTPVFCLGIVISAIKGVSEGYWKTVAVFLTTGTCCHRWWRSSFSGLAAPISRGLCPSPHLLGNVVGPWRQWLNRQPTTYELQQHGAHQVLLRSLHRQVCCCTFECYGSSAICAFCS